jgi:hypothetical protein
MAIFKANYVKRGKDAPKRAKASVRYIQHRRGKDGEKISRTLFNGYGPMDRQEAYSIIDEAAKGAYFYRFIISPDPKREDHQHDLDMRDIALQTMLALEELLGVHIEWVGATHADHAPHLHAHLIAVVPKRLYVKDFQALRQKATEASLEQREWLDLVRGHQRERPYRLPTVARKGKNSAWRNRHQSGKWGHYDRHASASVSRSHSSLPLRTCVCPRCNAVHIHTSRDPAHRCSCGVVLHMKKALSLTREQGRERERGL